MPPAKPIRRPRPRSLPGHHTPHYSIPHSDWVSSVAFSPNGSDLVSASRDGTIRLWTLPQLHQQDLPTPTHTTPQPTLLWTTRHGSKVSAVCASDDGHLVASGGLDGRIVVWCARTGRNLAQSMSSPSSQSSSSSSAVADTPTTPRIWSVRFSPDSRRIASAAADGSVCLWDAYTGFLVAGPLVGHRGSVYTVAFSPDGAHLASGGSDGRVCVWDLQSHLNDPPPLQIQVHTDAVRALVLAPPIFTSDSDTIFSVSNDSTMRATHASTGALLTLIRTLGHSALCALDITHDGRVLAIASRDNTVHLWNTATRTELGPLICHPDWVNAVALSRDGRYLASAGADANVRVFRLDDLGVIDEAKMDKDRKSKDGAGAPWTTVDDPPPSYSRLSHQEPETRPELEDDRNEKQDQDEEMFSNDTEHSLPTLFSYDEKKQYRNLISPLVPLVPLVPVPVSRGCGFTPLVFVRKLLGPRFAAIAPFSRSRSRYDVPVSVSVTRHTRSTKRGLFVTLRARVVRLFGSHRHLPCRRASPIDGKP